MITLAELKTQCRERADMEESQFVSDSELTSYINASIAELHDLLIAAYCEDYIMEEVIVTTTSAIDYELPDGVLYSAAPKFYKLRGVDVRMNSTDQWATVKRFNFNRRNEDNDSFAWNLLGLPYIQYRLVGSKIRFNRTPTANSQFRLFYYPVATKLVDDADEFDDLNQYAEYVILDVAIKMLNKEESDVTVLGLQKAAMKERIEAMAKDRDANEPESITDIYAEDTDTYFLTGRS